MDKTDDDDTETSKSRDGCSPNTVNKKQTEKLDTTKKDVIEEPHYTIVHRGYIDYQDYTTARLERLPVSFSELLSWKLLFNMCVIKPKIDHHLW
jgi:hypothetical protein